MQNSITTSLFAVLVVLIQSSQVSQAQTATVQASSQETAAEVDRLLTELLQAEGAKIAPVANDEDFLRRVTLDLAGVVPSPKDVTLFGLNAQESKRSQMIDSLLASDDFGTLWGSYWRDVVFSRATEQRARLVQGKFEAWLVEQFNENRPWDEITRALITATGVVQETGETGLIFAHTGQPEELAAEISRIFMGIQMSCANCHDHPTDSWKRVDFHQLAAFLPRITVRREEPNVPTSFAVRSLDSNSRRGRRQFDADRLLEMFDRNRDGALVKNEVRGPLAERFDQLLQNLDADKNKKLSKTELSSIGQMANNNPGAGAMEYYMPNLNDPASKGTLTQPVFFVPEVRGPELREDADDLTRRHALVDYITSPSNPWFAKAFVNRIWAEMLGEGFYMPIDDMGPERVAMFEEVLDVLAAGFVENDYNVKWVFRTIANTQAYQRSLQLQDEADYVPPFASASPTRLRADQIYQSLGQVLGTPGGLQESAGRFRQAGMARRGGLDRRKQLFDQTFGVDPSTPKEDILGNVPQGLFMMNSPLLEQMIRGTGDTKLARILQDQPDNQDALSELYLLVLSREPTEKELKINTDYVSGVGDRTEAFEDIMWSLLNSTEFLSKR
ncbi:DUF1549 domain-containing protein [Thalassoglobus sp.]|uniref:DUF1549 domain-containing protein n=1 Tax=Thalassoglobus sp. TaxID=2795869 RepID=UPI003AA80C00